MSKQRLEAKVIDTNHKAIGKHQILVELNTNENGGVINHKNKDYYPTGKTGINNKTGKPSFELATESDERIWSNYDYTRIWED